MESATSFYSSELWQKAIDFVWHDYLTSMLAIIVIVSFILFRLRHNERPIVRNALTLFALSLIALIISGLLHASANHESAIWIQKTSILIQGIVAIRLASLFLFRIVLPSIKISLPSILQDVIVFVTFLLWTMMQLHFAGLDLEGIVTTSAILTAIIAFSMKDTLGNLLGGIALQWDHSLKCGDWIRINDIEGKVVDIRWRAIFVETRNWETVVIPNSIMMTNSFKVLGERINEPVQWRRWIKFNIDYKVPPSTVIKIAEDAVRTAEIPNLSRTPTPNCLFMNYETSYGDYALRYWLTDLAVDAPTDSLVRTHLFSALERAGISPALVKQQLYLTKENEKHETLQHEKEIEQRISILMKLDLFSSFKKSELHHIANELIYTPFSRAETITKHGDIDHWLYIIISGTAGVYLKNQEGLTEQAFKLQHGDIFGEMGLMTGEPRTASVIAEDEMKCYRLNKHGFYEVIHTRPEIIEEISHVLIKHKNALDQTREKLDAESGQLKNQKHHSDLVNRIRRFIGIKDTTNKK